MDTPESPDNYGYVCDLHVPRPDARYQHIPPHAFIGCCVKRAFGSTSGRLEHMWVFVDGVTPSGHLIGRLDNDPVLDCGLVCGDVVEVALDQIEAVSG